MRNKIISLFIIFSLILLFILVIAYSNSVINSVLFSISIWKDNLLPALFPFFVLSDLMIKYGVVDFFGGIFHKFMSKVFYLPGSASFVVFGSMFSGFPSGSKYIVNLLNSNLIDVDDANYLIMFTHFSNPIFIIGSIGIMILGNIQIGYLILVIHFLVNFIIAFIFKKKKKILSYKLNFNDVINRVSIKRKDNPNFIIVLTNAILSSFKTLLLMLGIITVFLMITTIICNVLDLDALTSGLLSGILEITQGIEKVSHLNLPMYLKASIIAFFISFGGLSIHFQVISIIQNTNIKYKYFFLARVLHALIAGILVFIILYYDI